MYDISNSIICTHCDECTIKYNIQSKETKPSMIFLEDLSHELRKHTTSWDWHISLLIIIQKKFTKGNNGDYINVNILNKETNKPFYEMSVKRWRYVE